MNVLVVDDDRSHLETLRDFLEAEGFAVTTAENGQEALLKAQSHLPDLIISDLSMPVMDGHIFCRLCKEDDLLKQVPFVFFSATYDPSRGEALAAGLGADRFVLKPQTPDKLIGIMKAVWEERGTVREQ